MGNMKFDGTPEEWDAIVGKNKVIRIDDINEEVAEMIKQNEQIISDEEIEKQAKIIRGQFIDWSIYETSAYIMGAKWYREQLKLRQ
jgi:hypothetical protein